MEDKNNEEPPYPNVKKLLTGIEFSMLSEAISKDLATAPAIPHESETTAFVDVKVISI